MAEVQAQQTPQTPPAVAVPPVTATVLVGGYDPQDGTLRALNLDTLRQLQALAERLYTIDRLDDRNRVEAVIAAGAAVGSVATKELVVPDGEVWFINRLVLVSPAESGAGVGDIVQVNARISRWPKTDTTEKGYWSAARGTAAQDTYTIDLPAQGELGEELRLEAGDKLTLVATLTGAAAGADLTASLTPYGRRGKKLI
jgi:hypothetical protein